MIAWGTNLSQRWRGNFGSHEHRPAMMWSFNVWIARSAVFRRCVPAGVSWKSIFSSCMYSCSNSEASLSNRCRSGVNPRRLNRAMLDLYAVRS